jgi:flavin reductase (DIM6/NTAB) family NADH-FMN oxidoreductase RutF
MKKKRDLDIMWHDTALIHPLPVTIVTSIDSSGAVNAGAFSLVLPYCVTPQNPQILLIVNPAWHTADNIQSTGEFVVNYPSADYIDAVIETARFYPEGVNELEKAGLTPVPARHVRPPLIAECHQHIECRARDFLWPSPGQLNIIADVLEISADEKLISMERNRCIAPINPPVYFGMNEDMHHLFCMISPVRTVTRSLNVD